MRIRRATMKDLSALLAMDTILDADADRCRGLRQAIKARTVHVLTERNRVVAYGAMAQNFFGRFFVEMLFVAKNERRRGMGSALMGLFEKMSLHSGEVWTSTNQSNRRMQRLLKGRGYVLRGKVVGLDEGDPELIYQKKIAR
ncbi:MAG: GNAT family N-acetyltransferase [Opitutaceae bacterium]